MIMGANEERYLPGKEENQEEIHPQA